MKRALFAGTFLALALLASAQWGTDYVRERNVGDDAYGKHRLFDLAESEKDKCWQVGCLIGSQNEFKRQITEIKSHLANKFPPLTNELLAKGFRKFVAALTFHCKRNILVNETEALQYLGAVNRVMKHKGPDDPILVEDERYIGIFEVADVGAYLGDLEITEDEQKFMNMAREAAKNVTRHKITYRSRLSAPKDRTLTKARVEVEEFVEEHY